MSLVSPKFDLPLKNARWDLYLPPDYDYSRFEGSMTRTSDATLPVEQVYSLSEYNVQQRAQEEQSKLEVRYGLESARKDLAGRQPAEGDQQLRPRQIQERQERRRRQAKAAT